MVQKEWKLDRILFVGKEGANSNAIAITTGCSKNIIRKNIFYDFDTAGYYVNRCWCCYS